MNEPAILTNHWFYNYLYTEDDIHVRLAYETFVRKIVKAYLKSNVIYDACPHWIKNSFCNMAAFWWWSLGSKIHKK